LFHVAGYKGYRSREGRLPVSPFEGDKEIAEDFSGEVSQWRGKMKL